MQRTSETFCLKPNPAVHGRGPPTQFGTLRARPARFGLDLRRATTSVVEPLNGTGVASAPEVGSGGRSSRIRVVLPPWPLGQRPTSGYSTAANCNAFEKRWQRAEKPHRWRGPNVAMAPRSGKRQFELCQGATSSLVTATLIRTGWRRSSSTSNPSSATMLWRFGMIVSGQGRARCPFLSSPVYVEISENCEFIGFVVSPSTLPNPLASSSSPE